MLECGKDHKSDMDTLLVEDDPIMRELLQGTLEGRGHKVSAFEDAESAWQACQGRHYSLFLVDWMLPGMDGLELCRRIRGSQADADNLILVITARTQAGDLEQVLAAGADDYLAKPVDLQLLNVRLTIAEQRVKLLQKQAATTAALRTSQAHFGEAQRIAHLGIWHLDIASNKLIWSDEIFRIFELEPSSFGANYESFMKLIHPADRELVNDAYLTSVARRTPYAISHRLLMADGRVKWVSERGESVYAADGKPLLSTGTVQDITENKRIEDALLLQRDIIENGTEGIVLVKAADATIHYCNRRFEVLFGYEPGELIGKHISVINASHEQTPQEVAGEINRQLEENWVWNGENLNCKKDGTTLWTYISASTFKHPELGTLWIAYQKDISERKQADAALLDHAALYRVAVETSVDGFWAVDARGRLCEVNNAYVAMSGYSRDELLNMSIPDMEALERPEETAKRIEKIMREGGEQFESMHRKKDGSLWPVKISTSYSPLLGGRFFAFINDLTEKQHKDFLLQQQSRLASMGEMIGNIAHQWRQPINALGMILYDLEDAITHGQCDREYLHSSVEKSHAVIKRMSETIDDFRNFFRIDNKVAEFDLQQLVQNSLKLMEAVLQHQQIAVTTKYARGVMVSGRTGDFSQGLLNVLANAKDAIAAKNVAHGQIDIEITEDESNGIVIISDNGGGIASDIIPKIFDPYFTTKPDGIGIGLYMTRMAIEKNMRGQIEVDNSGPGARFTIRLPKSESGELACRK